MIDLSQANLGMLPEQVDALAMELETLRVEAFEDLKNSECLLPYYHEALDTSSVLHACGLDQSLRFTVSSFNDQYLYITPIIRSDYVPAVYVWPGNVRGQMLPCLE